VTGDKVQDGTKALAAGTAVAANFDEQQGLVGRLSWMPFAGPDFKWLIGVNGTYVMKLPDLIANGTAANISNTPGAATLHTLTLSDPPELTVDSNGTALATTGALPAGHVTQWGGETAAEWGSLYGQAGYYGFQVARSPLAYTQFTASGVSAPTIVKPTDDNFNAWYLQGSWILTSPITSPPAPSPRPSRIILWPWTVRAGAPSNWRRAIAT
jgi:phosphate-selective porin OprO/OprP